MSIAPSSALGMGVTQAPAKPGAKPQPPRGLNYGPDDSWGPCHNMTRQLFVAIEDRDVVRAKFLIEEEFANPGAVGTTDGETPLLCAIRRGDLEMVEMLLEYDNVDVNVKTTKCETPLRIAKRWQTGPYKERFEAIEKELKRVEGLKDTTGNCWVCEKNVAPILCEMCKIRRLEWPALYCSEECRAKHWVNGHRELCEIRIGNCARFVIILILFQVGYWVICRVFGIGGE